MYYVHFYCVLLLLNYEYSAPNVNKYFLIQAIQDLELPCKFAEKGCKYVAARSTLREHIKDCPFDLRVECQHWICKEMMSLEKLVDHLQEAHGCSKLQPRDAIQ